MFDAVVQEKLGYYVYALKKPTGEIFYVGKGVGNRCFDHIAEAQKNMKSTPKLDQIRLLNNGADVQIDIIRHGLSEEMALAIEAAIIDVLGLTVDKKQQIRGHGFIQGIERAKELQIRYGAKELISQEPILLIKINKTYKTGMSLQQVYEITRKSWPLNMKRVEKCNFLVLGVANGIVRGVFQPTKFDISPDNPRRKYFIGNIIANSPYLNTTARAFSKKGQAFPLIYLNMP